MRRDDRAWLTDIVLAGRRAIRYTRAMSLETFLKDELTQDAVLRCLEVIGEAAGNVSPQFRDDHDEIPWSQIIAFRNRLIHGYFEVDLTRVWSILIDDVSVLLQLLEGTVDVDPDDER
jgi:uncharacterized protein with HEPN domain